MTPYYQDAKVTLYHGDCREVIPQLGKYDLLLTDPPYGIGLAKNPLRQAHAKKGWDASTPTPEVLQACIDTSDLAVIWGGNYFPLPPQQCFLIWDKMQPETFTTAMCEMAWTNLPGPAKMFQKRVAGSYVKGHPTQKPVDLMTWCIARAKLQAGQTIIDPFAGSGTTGRAAKDLGLACTLIELDEEYCELIVKRLQQEVMF